MRENETRKKKTRKKKKLSSDVQKYSKWFEMSSFGGDGAGIWIVQDLLSHYAKCHEMPFCMRDRLISRMRKLEEARKRVKIRGKQRWRFGIYNLAWWTTVTSHHQINLCKCPYVSPVCPSMLPHHHNPFSSLVLQMRHKLGTQAGKSWAQKQINPCLCWLTEQAHVLQRRWNKNAQKEEKHTLQFLGFFSFGLPFAVTSILSFSVSLCEDENNTK